MSDTPNPNMAYPPGMQPPPPGPAMMSPAPMPPPKKGMNGVVIGCLVAVVVAVVLFILLMVMIFAVVMGATAAPVEAADKLLATMESGAVGTAYDQTSTGFHAVATEPQFEAFVVNQGLAQAQKATWTSRNVNNDTAELSGKLHFRTGIDKSLSMSLQKEGGAWKVSNIDITP